MLKEFQNNFGLSGKGASTGIIFAIYQVRYDEMCLTFRLDKCVAHSLAGPQIDGVDALTFSWDVLVYALAQSSNAPLKVLSNASLEGF